MNASSNVNKLSGLKEILSPEGAQTFSGFCQNMTSADVFKELGNLFLKAPILDHYFFSGMIGELDITNIDTTDIALAIFSPDSEMQMRKTKVFQEDSGGFALSGLVRVPRPAKKYILILADLDGETRFAVAELDPKKINRYKDENDHAMFNWVEFDAYNTKKLSISKTSINENLNDWLSILDTYGIGMATVGVLYAKQDIAKMRTLLGRVSKFDTDLTNSQLLTTAKISTLELNVNIFEVYVKQVRNAAEQSAERNGLTALHGVNSLYSAVSKLSDEIHDMIGFSKNAPLAGTTELSGGGPLMSGMLVSEYLVDRLDL